MESLFIFLLFVLTAGGFTAGWLTSPLVDGPRNWLIARKNKFRYLGICSLCSGFWISLSIEWMFLVITNITTYILLSITSCFVIWILYTLVEKLTWQKAYYEKKYYEM